MKDRDIVFDLDGTLIASDIGETLFYHTLLTQTQAPLAEDADIQLLRPGNLRDAFTLSKENLELLMAYQTAIGAASFREAYLLTAKWLERYSRGDLERLIRALFEKPNVGKTITCQGCADNGIQELEISYGTAFKPDMLAIVRYLQSCQARLWIVSASPQEVCEIMAERIGIPREHVLGAKSNSGNAAPPQIPWGDAKTALLREAGVVEPLIVFGDSAGDLDMLAAAKFPVVMADRSEKMLAIAEERGWWVSIPEEIPEISTQTARFKGEERSSGS